MAEISSDPSFAALRLDAQLCFPLYAVSRAVTKRYGELLADLGLTYPQYLVMLVLWESGAPVTVSELGAHLRLDSGTLTPLLKRLEGSGLVRRARDDVDERRVRVSLTDAGAALRERATSVPVGLKAALGISEAEAGQLRAELLTLLANLESAALSSAAR